MFSLCDVIFYSSIFYFSCMSGKNLYFYWCVLTGTAHLLFLFVVIYIVSEPAETPKRSAVFEAFIFTFNLQRNKKEKAIVVDDILLALQKLW